MQKGACLSTKWSGTFIITYHYHYLNSAVGDRELLAFFFIFCNIFFIYLFIYLFACFGYYQNLKRCIDIIIRPKKKELCLSFLKVKTLSAMRFFFFFFFLVKKSYADAEIPPNFFFIAFFGNYFFFAAAPRPFFNLFFH